MCEPRATGWRASRSTRRTERSRRTRSPRSAGRGTPRSPTRGSPGCGRTSASCRRPASVRRSGRDRLARIPRAVLVPAAIAVLLLVGPLVALLVRAPWGQLPALLGGDTVLPALGLSLGTAAASTGCCVLLGVPLAVVLAGADAWPSPLRRLARALVTTPLVLPPVVGGVALLLLLGRVGLLGGPVYRAFGIQIPFTTASVIIAQTFVGLPFLVLGVEGA